MGRTQARRRGVTNYTELLAVIMCSMLLAAMTMAAVPMNGGCKTPANKQKCANNLKGLGIAMILYSNDYRYFPHMKPLDQPNTERDVSKVYRTLMYFKYVDDAEGFICPSSEDFFVQPSEEAVENPRIWGWEGAVSSGEKPIFGADPDPELLANLELSYTYLRRRLNASSARSDTIISADKALRADACNISETSSNPEIPGNHSDGFNVAYADGHVSFRVNAELETMKKLVEKLHMGPYVPDEEAGQ